MLKHTFYAPPEAIAGDTIVLPEEEASHAVRVLRIKTGTEAAVVDGIGGWYRIKVEVKGRNGLVGRVLEKKVNVGEPAYQLTIGLSLLKNMARFETFAEKAVEYGVSRIIPLIGSRTERSRIRETRIEKLLISAMKQSGRSRKVTLDSPVRLQELSTILGDGDRDGEFRGVCHEKSESAFALRNYAGATGLPDRAVLLVGPEGGFTDDEIELLGAMGFKQIYLGNRRLRAESAAMAVATAFLLAENSD